jgi:hypothetical protein
MGRPMGSTIKVALWVWRIGKRFEDGRQSPERSRMEKFGPLLLFSLSCASRLPSSRKIAAAIEFCESFYAMPEHTSAQWYQ